MFRKVLFGCDMTMTEYDSVVSTLISTLGVAGGGNTKHQFPGGGGGNSFAGQFQMRRLDSSVELCQDCPVPYLVEVCRLFKICEQYL